MRTRRAQGVLDQLRRLAVDDEARLAVVKDRLARAERELASARSDFESAHARAAISQRVALAAEELLPHATQRQAGDRDPGPTGPEGGKRTLGDELIALAGSRRRLTRREIVEHLVRTRPDIARTGIGPELTRLVKAGMLARLDRGVYEIPSSTRGDDA